MQMKDNNLEGFEQQKLSLEHKPRYMNKVEKNKDIMKTKSPKKTHQNSSSNSKTKTEEEQDIELKILFKKILWQMGHYGRIDVKIAGYGDQALSGRRDGIGELTDIDVLGISFYDDFQVGNIIIDCKNGEKVSPSNRLFWLKGVMESIGNSRGYLVMGKKIIPSYLREMAKKFNVSLMDGNNITAFKRIYNIDQVDTMNIFSKELFYKQERITDKSIAELLEYRKYHYWIDEEHTRIHNLLSLLSKNANNLKQDNKNHQAVVMDFCILFTIVLIKICSYIMQTSLSNPKIGVIIYLYNGRYNLDKYMSVLDLFGRIFEATAQNYEEIRKVIDYRPPFYQALVELCINILRRPKESKDILRYMDIALYSSILPGKDEKQSVKDVLQDNFNEITNKLMFDIFDFIQNNTGINKQLIPRKIIYM